MNEQGRRKDLLRNFIDQIKMCALPPMIAISRSEARSEIAFSSPTKEEFLHLLFEEIPYSDHL
jgi:hypothetical protein